MRTVASLGLSLYAAHTESLMLLLVGLGVYWVGDAADGLVARLMDQETRTGAVLDIVSDRLCAAGFYVGFVWLDPSMWLPVGLFLLEFAVIDTLLSLAFLAWPLVSPNYFFLVDRPIWWANWSKIGKGVNSSAVALLMVFTRSVPLCVAVAVALIALKLWSTYRLSRLDVPVPRGCAASPSPAADPGATLTGHR